MAKAPAKKKPGKYDHLLPNLPPLPPSDLDYQAKVEDEKIRMRTCAECYGTGYRPLSFVEVSARVADPQLSEEDKLSLPVCGFCGGQGWRRLDAQQLAARYVIARADVATVEAAAFRANLALEAVSQMLIANNDTKKDPAWGAFGASDNALKMTNGDNIRLQGAPFPLANDKDKFRDWCYDNGLRGKMELPAKPLLDMVKLRLLNGDSDPEGVKTYVRTSIVYTPMKTEVASSDDKPISDDDAF